MDLVARLVSQAEDRELAEAVPHLRRLITERAGFSEPGAAAECVPRAAAECVRTLAVLEGKTALPFLREALAENAARLAAPELEGHRWHNACAILPGILVLDPEGPETLAAAQTAIERLSSAVVKGVLERPVAATDVLAFVWALEQVGAPALRDAIRPLASFEPHERLAAEPEEPRWPYMRAQVRDLFDA